MESGRLSSNYTSVVDGSPIPKSDDGSMPATNGLGRKVRNIDIPLAARRGFTQPPTSPLNLDQQFESAACNTESLTSIDPAMGKVVTSDLISDSVVVDGITVRPKEACSPILTYADTVKDKSEAAVSNVSFADILKDNNQNAKVNFRFLMSESMEGVDVVLPREAVKVVHDRFQHTLYGYFLGNRLAFPVVEYYVKQRWVRFGLQKVMMNADGFFFFKFSDAKGMNAILQEGPCLIRNVPLFLNCWNPSVSLRKEGVKKVTVWVKIHKVPLAAYTDDGLSMIATKIGIPKDMDAVTMKMCNDSWGKSSYARVKIELSADKDLKEEISAAIPDLEGDGYHKETMKVEYEWKPLRCGDCCVFGHDGKTCSNKPKPTPKVTAVVDNEGFQAVKSKGAKPFVLKPNKPKVIYKPVVKNKELDKVKEMPPKPNVRQVDTQKDVIKPFNYQKMI